LQNPNREFLNDVIKTIPELKRRALRLCYDVSRADDLVQETLLRAIQRHHQFQLGSNLVAWLMTILKNCFLSDVRKDRRRRDAMQQMALAPLAQAGAQEPTLRLREIAMAMRDLPQQQRSSLVLVGVESTSYAEAAERCGVSVGTIKSRVSRARRRLEERDLAD
jgi:RNA polymerase sigma-70 factor, ECF subfamily